MYKSVIAGLTAISMLMSSPAHANERAQDQVGSFLSRFIEADTVADIINNHSIRPNRPEHEDKGWRSHNVRDRTLLPRRCLQNVETRFGPVTMFPRDCLRQNYGYTDNLPRSCEVRVATHNGPRNGYDDYCLRQSGYQMRRRY